MNETLKRALSGIVYICLLISCILYSKESLALLFGFFLIIGTFEFSKLVTINQYISLLMALVSYYFLWNKFDVISIRTTLISIALLVSITLVHFLFNRSKTTFPVIINYILLFGYIIIPFIITNYITIGKNNVYNGKILLSVFILIWTNDTFAYLVGKQMGKHKLFPSVSPKKTIEGFIGGLIFTIISSILISKFYIESRILYIWIIIAIIVSIFSTLGDLIQSKLKRVAGVKDSGNIMPGHGGVLDRLDSIIFVVPFINLFYLILYYVS